MSLSFNGHVHAPSRAEYIGYQLNGITVAEATKQRLSKPFSVGTFETQRAAKYLGLVTAAQVCAIKAVVLKLADVEDGPLSTWNCHRPSRNHVAASEPISSRSPSMPANSGSTPMPRTTLASRIFKPSQSSPL